MSTATARGKAPSCLCNNAPGNLERQMIPPSCKVRPTLLLLSLAIILLPGCDSHTRHKTLTFFFTGVPPLAEDIAKIEEKTAQDQLNNEPQAAAVEIRSAHSYFTQRKCLKCHKSTMPIVSGGSGRTSRRVREPASDTGKSSDPSAIELGICVNCHENPFQAARAGEPRNHAPVGCSVCHLPHQSEYPKLLRNEAAKICTMCHLDAKLSGKDFHQAPLRRDYSD